MNPLDILENAADWVVELWNQMDTAFTGLSPVKLIAIILVLGFVGGVAGRLLRGSRFLPWKIFLAVLAGLASLMTVLTIFILLREWAQGNITGFFDAFASLPGGSGGASTGK